MADRTAADELKAILDLLQTRGLQAKRVRVGEIEVELSAPSQSPAQSSASEPSASPPSPEREREERGTETRRLLGIPAGFLRRTVGE